MNDTDPVFGRRGYRLQEHPETGEWVLHGVKIPWLNRTMQAECIPQNPSDKWRHEPDPEAVAQYLTHVSLDEPAPRHAFGNACGIYILKDHHTLGAGGISDVAVEAWCVGWGLTETARNGWRCEFVQVDMVTLLPHLRWLDDIDKIISDLRHRYAIPVRLGWDPDDGVEKPAPKKQVEWPSDWNFG